MLPECTVEHHIYFLVSCATTKNDLKEKSKLMDKFMCRRFIELGISYKVFRTRNLFCALEHTNIGLNVVVHDEHVTLTKEN